MVENFDIRYAEYFTSIRVFVFAELLLIATAYEKEKTNNNNSVTYTVTTLPGTLTLPINVAVYAA